MDDRLQRLEASVAELAGRLQRLEVRLAAIDHLHEPATVAPPPAEPAATEPAGAVFPAYVALTGRTFLVLGGGFLIRALSDGKVLPLSGGIALALALAAVSVWFADRAGRAGKRASAVFHGVAAALIAYPLAVETATRLGAMSGGAAAAVVGVLTALLIFAGWRHGAFGLAWFAVVSGLAASIALLQGAEADGALTIVWLALAAATGWLAERHGVRGLRWPVLLFADVLVLRGIYGTTQPDGSHGGALVALAFALALSALSLGVPAIRTLVRGGPVAPFHFVQAAAGAGLGIVAIVRVGGVLGWSTAPAGVLALTLSAAALLIALRIVPEDGAGGDFGFYLALGLGLLFAGGALALPETARALLWATAGVLATLLGRRTRRTPLWTCAAALFWAAAASAGLLAAAADAFTGAPTDAWAAPGIGGVLITAFALAGAIAAQLAPGESALRRLPPAATLLLAALGSATLLVFLERSLLGGDAAFIATGRTLALVVIATLLAAAGRLRPEPTWLAYLLLVACGLKLLAEDLRQGRALTLLVAFVAYGLALTAVQRLQRHAGAPPAGH